MPELPEVERAAALVRSLAKGKRIHHVETTEDKLVFAGLTHDQFAKAIAGRTVMNAARYGNPTGKYFYIELDGSGRMPVLHFGMTGMLKEAVGLTPEPCAILLRTKNGWVETNTPVRGHQTPRYISTVGDSSDSWPPRFVKFILFIQENDLDASFIELAFCDVRRLGRIRMVASPLTEPPISELGFDPILSMPFPSDFHVAVSERSCPIKALLLDQSFSAGIGNYLADEILYQAKVHPEQRCNTLDATQILSLHHQIADVCRLTVEVNADDSKYPGHWLFNHRWGKGKKAKQTMKLPSGEPATIKWTTVGGRTSAYVTEVQKLSPKRKSPEKKDVGSTATNTEEPEPRRSKRPRAAR